MKATKLIYLIAIIALFTTSCEKMKFGSGFLEKEPSIDVTVDTIFSSLELAERYLWSGYRTLPYGLNLDFSAKGDKLGMDLLESLTDLNHSYLPWGGTNGIYYNGQYAAASESTNRVKYNFTTEQSWIGIRIGWNFIQNANRIPDSTPQYIDQLKAEAKMIIAIHYVDMYRHFGGLPWVDRAYNPSENTDLPRSTAKETMEKIVTLLDEAIVVLPWTVANPSTDDGRFTKAAAMGLKARLLLFAASPLFNSPQPYLAGEASEKKMTWFGGYDANMWNRAAQASKELLDNIASQGVYKLVSTGNFRKDFQDAYYKRGNNEILISTRVRFRTTSNLFDGNYYFYQSARGYGTACPTKEYVDMFPMANGMDINAPGSGWNPSFPWRNRDPRLYETVLVNGDTYRGRTAELYIGGQERPNINYNGTASGFGLKKFLLDANAATSLTSIVQWPYLRLSEIYLTYAEALNEANGGPTAEAYAAINIVRSRVGLNSLSGLNQIQFRAAVLRERALELGFEEVRWFDLIRWKQENVFKQKLNGVNTTRATTAPFTLTYTTFPLPSRYWQDNFSPKWYLSAFPPNEVNKGYGLVQNPGW
jgi:hypothetical protein